MKLSNEIKFTIQLTAKYFKDCIDLKEALIFAKNWDISPELATEIFENLSNSYSY